MAAPIPVPLPALPSTDFWTETQWAVYLSFADAVLPSVVAASALTDRHGQVRISDDEYAAAYRTVRDAMSNAPKEEDFADYLRWSPSRDPRFVANVRRTLSTVPAEAQKRLGGVLNILA